MMFNGLKWNATTNMSRDMAETSVTDFFTLLQLGQWAGPPTFGLDHASKMVGSWPMDRVEIDAYDNEHRLILAHPVHANVKVSNKLGLIK